MSDHDPTTEATLCVIYERLLERYAHALGLAQNLVTAFRRGESGEAALEQLRTVLGEIAVISSQAAPAKLLAEPARRPGQQPLNAIAERLAELVAQLIQRIREAENAAHGRISTLVLELDDSIRCRKMLRAYGSVMTAGQP